MRPPRVGERVDDEGARHVADLEEELAALRPRLAREQQALESTRARVEQFEQVYARTIGVRLDELRILENGAAGPAAPGLAGSPGAAGPGRRPSAHEELQRLYRQTAQRVHPDLARDHGERVLRTKVMAEFNAAREARDLDRARQLVEDWEVRPDTIARDSPTARAAHLVRTIQRARARLIAVAEEHDRLRRSRVHVLMGIVEAQRRSGVDMLAETAADLDRQLAQARAAAAAPAAAPMDIPAVRSGLAPSEQAPAPGPPVVPLGPVPDQRRSFAAARRIDVLGLSGAAGAALAAIALVGVLGASLWPADRSAVVLLPSTGERPTGAASTPPSVTTPAPLPYRVVDRTTATSGRTLTTLRIVIDGQASRDEVISTLAAAARRELRSSQAIVVYAYRSLAEAFGPFTVGRAYLSADGRGSSGDGSTEDGPDDGGIVGSVVTAIGGSIESTPFRVAR